MTIKEFHDNIDLMNPSSDGRYFSPEQIDSAINIAVMDLYNQEYKNFEESQRISDNMSDFKAVDIATVTTGACGLPPDLAYITSLMATVINGATVTRRVELIGDQFINDILESTAFGPDEDNVYARRNGSGLQIRPFSVTEITISYLRLPVPAKYAYTYSSNGFNTIYNPTGSLQVDYPAQAHNEILYKALRTLGIAQKDQVLVQNEQVAKANNLPEPR